MRYLNRVLLVVFFIAVFVSWSNAAILITSEPPEKYEKILRSVAEMLKEGHFNPKPIDDVFSKKIYTRYFENLDPNKNIFLQSDIISLKKYETKIDDEMNGTAAVNFFKEAGIVFNKRMEEVALLYKKILEQPFDFTIDETILVDPKKISFTVSENKRKEGWKKWLKYQTLERYADALEVRENNKSRADFIVKTDATLEKEAREKVEKLMDRIIERYRFKFNEEDKFNLFITTITSAMDPHTEFLPPVDKRYFDEQMSGRYFGIGAALIYEEGNIKVSSVLAGTPAWKSGELQMGDIVLKVGQGNAEPVELTGFVVQDAVKLIRGEKGTDVTLTLKKQDGSIKTLTLVRDRIIQDEVYARSAIINNNGNKLGYIYLSEFYADFNDAKGNRSFIDVAKEIIKLKENKVDGIILDLRNNGGGSLYDVVQMVGLFIEKGPVVQLKDREGTPLVLEDKDRAVLYDGPFSVMVNEFSASASEIFAAAIQDYGRGVIIGSTTTFGKGTVQRNFGIDPALGFESANSEMGTLKLTLQKYYRVNGGSTQLKGVASDIVLPDNYEYLKFREKDDPDALPWDNINKTPITNWSPGYSLSTIQLLSKQRLQTHEAFKIIKENTEWLASQSDKEFSLHLDKYQKEQKAIKETVKKLEEAKKIQKEIDIVALPQDLNRFSYDPSKQERFDQWLKNLKKDIYIEQATQVSQDMITQRNVALATKSAVEKNYK